MQRPFRAVPGSTANINVSSSSQTVSLGKYSEANICIHNDGTATVWVEFGKSSVTASTSTSQPFGPGVSAVQRAKNDDGSPLYAAAIAAGSTGRVYFTVGEGI